MEEVLTRFPHLGENILQKLDSKSLIECKEVNRTFKNLMKDEKSAYFHVIQWYTNCSEYLMRKIVEKSGGAIIIVSILREIYGNLMRGTKQHHKHLQKWQTTPLHLAAEGGHLGAYHLIMENVINKNPLGMISDAITCTYMKRENFHAFHEATPLHLAAKNGNLAVCKLIIENIFDKNPTPSSISDESWMDQSTPLHLAASNGHFSVCELLINSISKKNPEDETGWTPLHSAAQNGHLRVVKLILDSLSAVRVCNTIDMFGNTPLKLAKQYRHKQIRTTILEYISNVEASKKFQNIHDIQYKFSEFPPVWKEENFNSWEDKEANGELEHDRRKVQKSQEASSNKRPFEGEGSASNPDKIWRYW